MKRLFSVLASLLLIVGISNAQVTGDPILQGVDNAFTLGDGTSATVTTTWDNTGTDVVLTVTTNAFNVSAGVIQQGGTPVVLETRTITGGVGIAAMGDLSANRTVTFDATELDALTWDAGSLASFAWTYSLSGASDPVISFEDGAVNLTTGVWQDSGTPVVLETRTLTGGNGIVTIGDLSTNRTITVQLLDENDGTGATSNQAGLEFGGAGSDEVGLLQGCADGEVLKWVNSTTSWDCSADVGSNPLSIASPAELTIATGAVTATCAADNICYWTIDTESDAATDDLTTFNCTAGSQHVIMANNDARTVVVQAHSGPDFSMDDVDDRDWETIVQ